MTNVKLEKVRICCISQFRESLFFNSRAVKKTFKRKRRFNNDGGKRFEWGGVIESLMPIHQLPHQAGEKVPIEARAQPSTCNYSRLVTHFWVVS